MKNSATIVIGIFALVIAFVAVYGLYNVNSPIQGKSDQVQVPNYTAQINSLTPQINSINNNMSSLSNLKGDISDIRGKLSDLETKINQAQQVAVVSAKPVIISGKAAYFPGEMLNIVAVGFGPQNVVQIQLLDNYGFAIMQKNVLADSGGRVVYNLQLPSNLVPGSFQVKLISGQLVASQSVAIEQSSPVSVSLSGLSYLFTAQTDKSVYQMGEQIEVYGIGVPNTTVTGILTSPSGTTLTAVTTVQKYGTYTMFISDSPPFETGIWSLTVKNQGLERIVYLTVQSGNFSPPTLTAQSSSIVYQAGDTIRVSGIGSPNTGVQGILTSPSGATLTDGTTAGPDGTYFLSYFVSSSFEKGNWHVTVSNDGQTRQVFIFIGPVSSSGGSFGFTAQADKTIYEKGDLIRISGTGPPYSSVNTVLTSPSGARYNGAATINFDGSYNIYYSTLPSFETGNWHITLTEGLQVRVISIFLEPNR